MYTPPRLDAQVVVITGATSGIGLVTARMAARAGARLVLAARNGEALDTLVDELTGAGSEALAVPTDVGRAEDVRRLGERAVERFGRIDTWVNNAGVSAYGRVWQIDLAEHRRIFETNYWGYVHGINEAVRHMRNRGGQIISVLSVLAERAIPMQGPYCASKHALRGLHDALRMELQEDGIPIEVSVVKPSAIDTPYKDHARNYFSVAPKNPPPVYSPDTVARAILHCAEHPRRDITVGLGGAAVAVMGRNFPALTDAIMNKTMSRLQRTDEPAGPADRHALFEPKGKTLRERGHYPHYVHETSLYTQARLHPVATAATIAGVVAAAGLLGTGTRSKASRAAGALAVLAGAWMLSTMREHGDEQPSVVGKLKQARGGYF